MKVYKKIIERDVYCRHKGPNCEGITFTKIYNRRSWNRKKKQYDVIPTPEKLEWYLVKGTELFVIDNDGENAWNGKNRMFVCKSCMKDFLDDIMEAMK